MSKNNFLEYKNKIESNHLFYISLLLLFFDGVSIYMFMFCCMSCTSK